MSIADRLQLELILHRLSLFGACEMEIPNHFFFYAFPAEIGR